MKLQSLILRNSLFVLALILAVPAFRASAQSKPGADQAQEKPAKPQQRLRPLPRNDAGLEGAQEGPEFLRRRQDWFFKPRAFPLGFIPQGARERALEQKRQMYLREGRFNLLAAPGALGFITPPTGPTSAWFSIGPRPTDSPISFGPFTSGRVTALAVNPNNASNVYLGGADGGLWVSTDGGSTWTALAQTENPPSAGIPTVAVGSLALDPTTCTATICTTVYVGTGEDNFGAENIYGEGVLKCTVTSGSPPTATCTQDSTFHFAGGVSLDDLRGGPMIGALAVNPKTGSNNILLAGVRGRGTAIESGIYCSADSGGTWTPVFGISGIVGTDVAFASDGTAFVALGFPFGDANGNNGIYKSSVVISSCTAVIDAANTTPGGAGSKWIKQTLPAGTPSLSLGRISLAIFPSPTSTGANATVYAAIADASGGSASANLLGFIKTTNGGTSWTQLTGDTRITSAGGVCNSQCFYDMPLAVSPASGNDVFFGGGASNGTLIRSVDGGVTWTEISRNNVNPFPADSIHVDMHAIAFSKDGSTMYVGNDGGTWKTINPTGTPSAGFWTNLNQDLNITQFYPGVSIHPANSGFSMGGTQDNDIQIYQGSNAMPLDWTTAQLGCDGGFTAIDFTNPSTSYGECEYVPSRAFFPIIVVTYNGDGVLNNGFLVNAGIDNTDRGSFIPPLVMNPNTPTTLYFGTCRVWATTDGANTWTAISPDVTTATHPANCPVPTAAGQPAGNLSTIATAPGNSNIIYVGSDDGDIEVTSNGGTSWATIANSAVLPTRAVAQIAVDPSTATTAYVTFSGFGSCNNSTLTCDGKSHVFKTINGTAGAGTTWVDISGTTTKLPDIPVNAIVIDPNDATHNTLYVGTDIGGFYTIDGGTNWSPLGAASSLPNAQILSLTLHNPSRTLRAATHGRGVWDLNLGGTAAFSIDSISPFSANAGAASITNFSVTGIGFTSTSVVNFAVNGTTTPLTTSCPSATSCTATIPAAQLLSGGTASITVTNTSPAGTTNAVPFTVLNPIPVINTISPTTVTAGTTNFSLIVNGGLIICGGANATVVLFNGAPRSNITACSAASLTVKLPDSDLTTAAVVPVDLSTPQPGGGPDTNPNPPTLTINAGTGNVSATATTVTTAPAAGGTMATGTSTITVGGFSGAAVITCGSLPGVTCLALTIPSGSTSGTLTIKVLDPSSAMTAMAAPSAQYLWAANGPRKHNVRGGWLTLSAGTGLAAILLLLLPGQKRHRAALGLVLVCALSFTIGCSGSKSGSGSGGTTATVTHLTVSSTKVAATGTLTVSATVTGGNPSGTVQFFIDGTGVSPTSPLSSGSTGNITLTAANAPPLFQLVGTHTLSAHYLGDANTMTSQSGTLNITVSGTANLPITGTSPSTTANGNLSLTIN